MTDKHIKQVEAQLPAGERINRMYRSCEGDIRVITRDRNGSETRYTVTWHPENDSVTIAKM